MAPRLLPSAPVSAANGGCYVCGRASLEVLDTGVSIVGEGGLFFCLRPCLTEFVAAAGYMGGEAVAELVRRNSWLEGELRDSEARETSLRRTINGFKLGIMDLTDANKSRFESKARQAYERDRLKARARNSADPDPAELEPTA